jgi:Protein of unknown function (DUF3667)
MSNHHKQPHTPYCLNCHYPTAELDNFCPNCGQKPSNGKITMHDLLHEFLHNLTHFDGKIVSSLRHALIPGKLTLEFFKGHHKRYAHPIQLFLVLGALSLFVSGKNMKDAEDSLLKIKFIDKENLMKKDLIYKLDSNVQKFAIYKDNPDVKNALDSLFFITHKTLESDKKSGNTVYGLVYFNNQLDIGKYKKYLKILNSSISAKSPTDSITLLNSLKQKTFDRLDSLRKDSAAIFQLLIEEMGDERRANRNITGISFGYSLNVKAKKDNVNLDTIIKDLDRPFKSKLIVEKDDILVSNQFKLERDSTKLSFVSKKPLKVADADIVNLKLEDFYKKYNIEGFWAKIWTKIVINYTTKGKDIVHNFFSKSVYISIIGLIPNSLFLLFLYRRQRKLWVEHIVFMLHFHCFQSLCSVINLIPNFSDYSSLLQMSIVFIALFFGLKLYYQQGWGKTIVKGLLMNIFIMLIPACLIFIGLALSFAFF